MKAQVFEMQLLVRCVVGLFLLTRRIEAAANLRGNEVSAAQMTYSGTKQMCAAPIAKSKHSNSLVTSMFWISDDYAAPSSH